MSEELKQRADGLEVVGWLETKGRYKGQLFGTEVDGCAALMTVAQHERIVAALSPAGGGVVTDAAREVLAERKRQISAEGWTPEHDDEHEWGELAGAAGYYALHVNARGWVYPERPEDYQCEPAPGSWPWDAEWWKPSSPRRDLVKAGALILAEIERIDRANAKPQANSQEAQQ